MACVRWQSSDQRGIGAVGGAAQRMPMMFQARARLPGRCSGLSSRCLKVRLATAVKAWCSVSNRMRSGLDAVLVSTGASVPV